MHMGKHHSHLIPILGIAVITGFLLFPSALAGPIYGFPTMGSAQSLMLSMHSLTANPLVVANGVSSSDSPVNEESPEEASPDDFDDYADDDPVGDESGPLESEPSLSLPDQTGPYDDEQLDSLVSTTGLCLMRLSMQHAHALYLQDTDAATIAAEELHDLSTITLEEARSLRVSPDREQIMSEFIRSLETHAAISEALVSVAGADARDISPLLRDLVGASTGLEAVQQQVSTAARDYVASAPETKRSPAALMSTAVVERSSPSKPLLLQERYRYDDADGENMISLILDMTRNATTYRDAPDSETEQTVEAGEGQMFLLVVVRATNLGHKGDSDLYTIETPDRSAFTLQYQESEYAPLETSRFTSLGESYSQQTLERYASIKGYLFFDVPRSMNLTEAMVSVDLGSAGRPVWKIGSGP
jgi:hypothetical protein